MNKLNKDIAALNRFSAGRVAVIGDIMLDAYLWGAVNRISPEAPVPVVDVRRRSCCPGGAANVMRNLATLHGQAKAFGIVGNDPAGREVINLLKDYGTDVSGIIRSNERRTTEKCRVVAGAQQLLRADFEDTTPISETDRDKLVGKIVRLFIPPNKEWGFYSAIQPMHPEAVSAKLVLDVRLTDARDAGYYRQFIIEEINNGIQ